MMFKFVCMEGKIGQGKLKNTEDTSDGWMDQIILKETTDLSVSKFNYTPLFLETKVKKSLFAIYEFCLDFKMLPLWKTTTLNL